MASRIVTTLVFALSLAAGACGGTTAGTGSSETNFQRCRMDSECSTGERCEASECVPKTAMSTDAVSRCKGAECQPDAGERRQPRSSAPVDSGTPLGLDPGNAAALPDSGSCAAVSYRAEMIADAGADATVPVPCEWRLPAPPDGEMFDPDVVNVQVTDRSGREHVLGQVSSAAECTDASESWFYDDPTSPTSVMLCPATCEIGLDGADILFGCSTIPNVPD